MIGQVCKFTRGYKTDNGTKNIGYYAQLDGLLVKVVGKGPTLDSVETWRVTPVKGKISSTNVFLAYASELATEVPL